MLGVVGIGGCTGGTTLGVGVGTTEASATGVEVGSTGGSGVGRCTCMGAAVLGTVWAGVGVTGVLVPRSVGGTCARGTRMYACGRSKKSGISGAVELNVPLTIDAFVGRRETIGDIQGDPVPSNTEQLRLGEQPRERGLIFWERRHLREMQDSVASPSEILNTDCAMDVCNNTKQRRLKTETLNFHVAHGRN